HEIKDFGSLAASEREAVRAKSKERLNRYLFFTLSKLNRYLSLTPSKINRRLDVSMTTRNKGGKPQAHFGASRIFRPC
ncbi:hypothetical protein, partial [Cloacibacillus porcorum]